MLLIYNISTSLRTSNSNYRQRQQPRAPYGVGKRKSTGVDEGSECSNYFHDTYKKGAYPVAGRGGKSLLGDPGSELRYIYGRRKRNKKCEKDTRRDEQKKEKNMS